MDRETELRQVYRPSIPACVRVVTVNPFALADLQAREHAVHRGGPIFSCLAMVDAPVPSAFSRRTFSASMRGSTTNPLP